MRLLMIGLTLTAAACAQTPREAATRAAEADRTRAELDRELAGLVPGEPRSCLQPTERRQMKAFGETLVYRNGATRYVTQTNGCVGVNQQNYLVTNTPTALLCRGDIASTIDRTSGFQTGGCSLGEFVPYRRP